MANIDFITSDEIWQTVEQWPRYRVSNFGQVRSHWWNPPRLLTPSSDLQGRLRVTVTDENRKHKTLRIHVLVAQAFLGPKPKGLEINHKNGIYTDNRASNLEYCTSKANEEHALLNGLKPRGERVGTSKLTNDNVREIRRLYNGKEYSSRKLAARFHVQRITVMRIVKGLQWKHIV